MGTDIDGVIESRSPDGCWEVAVDLLDFQLGRDYNAWNCLFDVRGAEDVRPLFSHRGLPNDVSDPVRESAADDCQHGHTYATWAEVAAVDWDAPLADEPAFYFVGEWRPGADGELVLYDTVKDSRILPVRVIQEVDTSVTNFRRRTPVRFLSTGSMGSYGRCEKEEARHG
ncbi:hypothetical protein [Nocardia sp. NBC_01009]|uniref:hypothetical protein n=1 Tax=Nocardia sp. NBC_01009 TaxID=2975996 RepID=UPI0038660D75|nr:hypothetical protein OHA42_02140 [Nocardia sp. NBC_01009]